jgi:CHAT domain-containing protein
VGLARGFLYAGARSILASLWSVDDMATANLMQGFYQALGRAGSAPEALRSAQQRVRRQHPHPFFWAAFQLSGRGD